MWHNLGAFRNQNHKISTHTPHARCDLWFVAIHILNSDFYSHTSCEVWRLVCFIFGTFVRISTHTPHARCDLGKGIRQKTGWNFYSHTSCEVWRGVFPVHFPMRSFLLTHLMRGVTEGLLKQLTGGSNFYSHTSCEVWRRNPLLSPSRKHFYSHTSCEVWLISLRVFAHAVNFYSHTSCEVWLIRHFL